MSGYLAKYLRPKNKEVANISLRNPPSLRDEVLQFLKKTGEDFQKRLSM